MTQALVLSRAFQTEVATILPQGGIALFAGQELMFPDWAEVVLSQVALPTTAAYASWLLSYRGIVTDNQFRYLLKELVASRKITKEEVITLYLLQSEDVRRESPYLTLSDMWGLYVGGEKDDDVFPVRKNGAQLFTQTEIVALAERVVSVSLSDVYMFFEQWFYRSECLLSTAFLEYWYKKGDERFTTLSGKLESLIVIALYERGEQKVTFQDVVKRLVALAKREPDSHGISRYIALLYVYVKKESDVKQKCLRNQEVLDAIIETIVAALSPYTRGNVFHSQTLLHFYIEDPSIPEEDKEQILLRVQTKCNEYGTLYFTYTDEAWATLQRKG